MSLFLMGASAGGRWAVTMALKSVSQVRTVAFLVVVHGSSNSPSFLPKILSQ